MLYYVTQTVLRICAVLLCALPLLGKPQSKKAKQFPCTSQLKATTDCVPCGLKEWAQKIFTLKERPVEFSLLPAKKEYQQNILTLEEFVSTLQKCATVIARSCQKDELWLYKKSLHSVAPEIFTLERSYTRPLDTPANFPFKPYTCRIQAQPGTEFALFGDLHGSAHSLVRDLLKLQEMGYLDDTFKIRKKAFNLLFLGDYIDRGIYGVEVMYTIARLKIANPASVILVRGNHEDYILAPEFKKKHSKEEEKDNAPSLIDELYRKFDLLEKHEVAIFRFYELLPQALYLGCGTAHHQDFMMCCHGGLELGYNPYALLHANPVVQFELIGTLWRKKHFDKKLAKQFQNDIKVQFDLGTLCGRYSRFCSKGTFFSDHA